METNTSTIYNAIKAAACTLSIDRKYIEHYIYLNQDKPVLGRYTFKLINLNDKKIEQLQKTSKNIEVTNTNTNEVTIYLYISAAARTLGYCQVSISLYLKDNKTKPFKGIYLFKLV